MSDRAKTSLFVMFWLACSAVSYGGFLADTQHGGSVLSCRRNAGFAALMSVTGPAALVMSAGLTGFYEHGFRWTCSGETERKSSRMGFGW